MLFFLVLVYCYFYTLLLICSNNLLKDDYPKGNVLQLVSEQENTDVNIL